MDHQEGGSNSMEEDSVVETPSQVNRDISERVGLSPGDVIVMLQCDVEARTMQAVAEKKEDDAEGTLWCFEPDDESAADTSSDARVNRASWLEVHRKENYIGFRSFEAGGRFLQVRRKGRRRLVFYNTNFGVWEQFEFAQGEPKISWSQTRLYFRSRQLPGFVLTAEVIRIGGVPRSAIPATPRSAIPGGAVPAIDGKEESVHGTVFRAMGSILAKEWSTFVQREVNSREGIEANLNEVGHDINEYQRWAASEIGNVRDEIRNEMDQYSEEIGLLHQTVSKMKEKKEEMAAIADFSRKYALYLLSQKKYRSVCGKVLDAWGKFTKLRCSHQRFANIIASRMESRVVAQTMWAWRLRTKARQRCEAILKRHLTRLSTTLLMNVFEHWISMLKKSRYGLRQNTLQALTYHATSLLRKCVQEWSLYLAEKAARREHALFAMHSNIKLRLTFATRAWHRYAGHQRQIRFHETFVIVRLRKYRMRNIFVEWFNVLLENERKKTIIENTTMRLIKRSAFRALHGWRHVSHSRRRNRNIVGKFARRIKCRAVAGSFSTWKGMSTDRRRRLQGAYRYVSAMIYQSKSDAFRSWGSIASLLKKQRGLVRKSLARIQHRYLCRAMRYWMHVVTESLKSKAMMSVVLKRMTIRRLSLALTGWKSNLYYRKHVNQLVHVCLVRMTRRHLYSAFGAMAEYAISRRRRANITRRVISRLRSRHLGSAFQSWLELEQALGARRRMIADRSVLFMTSLKRQAFTVWAKALHIQGFIPVARVLDRCTAQMSRRLETRALRKWIAYRDHIHHAREIAMYISGKKVFACISYSFNSWLQGAVQQVRNRMIANASLRRMVIYRSRAAFLAWRQYATESKTMKWKVDKMLFRLQSNGVVRAFNAWVDYSQWSRDVRQMASRCLRKVYRRLLNNAFEGWRGSSSALARSRRLAHRSYINMTYACKRAAFTGWLSKVISLHEKREQIARCVMKMGSRAQLARAFAGYKSRCVALQQARQILVKAMQRLFTSYLFAYFNQWCDGVVEQKRTRKVLSKSMVIMQRRRAVASFVAWRSKTIVAKRSRIIVARALSRVCQKQKFASFNRWLELVAESKHYTHVLGKVIAKLFYRKLHSAFGGWLRKTVRNRKYRSILGSCLKRLRFSTLWSAFNSWDTMCRRGKRVRSIAGRAVSRIKYRLQYQAFCTWVEGVSSLRKARALASGMIRRMTNRTLSAAFNGFVAACIERQRKTASLLRAIVRMRKLRLKLAFDNWIHKAAVARSNRFKILKHVARERRNLKVHVLFHWMQCVEESAKRVQDIRLCVKRKQVSQRFFLKWYWDAFDSDIQSALSEVIETHDYTLIDPSDKENAIPESWQDLRSYSVNSTPGNAGDKKRILPTPSITQDSDEGEHSGSEQQSKWSAEIQSNSNGEIGLHSTNEHTIYR